MNKLIIFMAILFCISLVSASTSFGYNNPHLPKVNPLVRSALNATSCMCSPTNPAGSNTEIQYNDNGAFGASPQLTLDLVGSIIPLLRIGKSGENGAGIEFDAGGSSLFDDQTNVIGLGYGLFLEGHNIASEADRSDVHIVHDLGAGGVYESAIFGSERITQLNGAVSIPINLTVKWVSSSNYTSEGRIGINATGNSCNITRITNGIITGAVCA